MRKIYRCLLLIASAFLLTPGNAKAQTQDEFKVIGYYAGPPELVDSFNTDQLTHIIFCFGHLSGNKLHISSARDTATIQSMIRRKHTNPSLKVLLSLGGWSGCKTCSDVFDTKAGREEFAESVKELTQYFQSDGLDLDWEYPAIQGYPGHVFRKEDKRNFTALVKEIRRVNGEDFIISFAAGGFTSYINESIEWTEVIRYTDFINVMTYDLVHGYSDTSGHHTPLYSTPKQVESTDHAVQMLLQSGVPPTQIVIGAAIYGRFFQIDEGHPVDLYMPCHFSHGFSYKHAADSLSADRGFTRHWDDTAQAPYAIHQERRLLASYDDEKSIALKTQYAIDNHLGGIMFWQLIDDTFRNGLLQTITTSK